MKIKKESSIKLCVAMVVIIFLILFFSDHQPKALSFLFISGGVLGLVTKTDPFARISKNPFVTTKLSYSEDSIVGPLMNIFIIFIGLICIGI